MTDVAVRPGRLIPINANRLPLKRCACTAARTSGGGCPWCAFGWTWESSNIILQTLGDFVDRLLERLPGLNDHVCNQGRPGGLVKRLREGTWLGHVIEHVALELQHRAGSELARGLTRSVKGRRGVYDVYYAYEEVTIGLAAGRLALKIVNSLLPEELRGVAGADFQFSHLPSEMSTANPEEAVEVLSRLRARLSPGPTTSSLIREAMRRNIPVCRLDCDSLVQLGQGKHQQRIRGSTTSATPSIAVDIASDKHLTERLLRKAGVPVPEGIVVESSAEAVLAARDGGWHFGRRLGHGKHHAFGGQPR